MPQICDYEGSRYRYEFWEQGGRAYEDGVERVAMGRMLPPTGRRLLEVGAGFGRLADLYAGYEQVYLTDYARTQLEEAQDYLGNDGRFIYVIADVYRLPFATNLFDTMTMVRVMHHLTAVPDALTEIQRVLMPDGTAIIEHASKQNLKAIARWLIGRQAWNPFSEPPVEFVELNFNFQPAWMRRQFAQAGLSVENCRTLSHYRISALKRLIPTDTLVWLDSLAQPTGNWWQLTPSLMLKATARKTDHTPATSVFLCPTCRRADLVLRDNPHDEGDLLYCPHCQHGWTYRGGIYDFKTPQEV